MKLQLTVLDYQQLPLHRLKKPAKNNTTFHRVLRKYNLKIPKNNKLLRRIHKQQSRCFQI